MSPGTQSRRKLMPQDCIAVISLPPESRPKARSVANSIDIGNVQRTTPGKLNMKIFATDEKDAPYSVMYSAIRNSVPDQTKTAVNAHILNAKVIATS